MQTERFQQTAPLQPLVNGYPFRDAVKGAFRCVLGSSKDLRRSDSCFDPWINLPASAIKRTVFLFSSSILCRNNENSSSILRRNSKDSSSCCDLAMPCMLLSSKGWAKIQAIAALLWVIYGIAIGSAPVAVANTIVGVAAIYTAFRAGSMEKRAEVGIEKPLRTVDGREATSRDGKKQTGRSLISELLAAAARLSYVPAQGKDGTPAYILSVGTIAWWGALPRTDTSR